MGLLGGGSDADIEVLPLGEVEPWLVREARHAVETRFGLGTDVADRVPLPEDAYDPDREQYDVEALMEAIEGDRGRRSPEWLAVTEADLYYDRNNYVFGTAYVGDGAAVASVYRLEAGDEDTARERWHKQVLKQVGHALGAERCDNERCLFNFTPTVRELDVQEDVPCGACRRELEAEGTAVDTGRIGEAPPDPDDPAAGVGDPSRTAEDRADGPSRPDTTAASSEEHVTAPTEVEIERARADEPETTDSRSESVDDVLSGLRFQAVVVTFLVATGVVLLVEAFLYDWLWGFEGIPSTHFWGLLAVAALVGLSLTRRTRAAASRAVAYVRS